MGERSLFKLKNNDVRSYSIAGRLCIAGSGCPTPPEAAKQVIDGQPFRLPGLFDMTEEEMFKSFRGVVAAMKTVTKNGHPAIEVFIEGVAQPLTTENVLEWVIDYRERKGLPEPKNRSETVRETELAMNRAEDPLERMQREGREREKVELATLIAETVITVLERRQAPAPSPNPLPAPTRGRNDEAPGDGPASIGIEPPPATTAGRARPRT